MRRATLFVAATASALAMTGEAAAQADQTWSWEGSRSSFCIWYLGEPVAAAAAAGPVAVRRAADMTDQLPLPLQTVIRDEPRFADWVPGVVCTGRYEEVSLDGRRVAVAEDGRSLVYTLVGIAADSPFGRRADWLLLDLGADAGNLHRQANGNRLGVERRRMEIRRTLPEEPDQWGLQLGDIKLFWEGFEAGERRVASTQSMSFGYAGDRNSTWRVEVSISGGTERDAYGALRVDGKGDLAEALKASPIRAMGPFRTGGSSVVKFFAREDGAP